MATRRRPEVDELGVEAVPWTRLRPSFLNRWEAGQHVAIVGPTGSGKSTVETDLLEGRADKRAASVVLMITKRRDPLVTKLGWPIIHEWPPKYEHRVGRKVIFWPPYGKASEPRKNRAAYANALDEILEEGGWTVGIDEAIYFTEQLGLRSQLDEYWNTARSAGITVVAGSQGTTWVPRPMLSQQSWVFGFRSPDEDVRNDLARIMGDRLRFGPVLAELGAHEFLLVRTLTGHAYVSKVGT